MRNCKEHEDILATLIANHDTVNELKNAVNELSNAIMEFGDALEEYINQTESYTDLALKTLNKDVFEQKDLILNASLGLSGEVGEVNDIIKKYMYHGHKLDDDMKEKIILELGDVCWYVALMAWAINKTKFEEVLNKNITKLDKRYQGEFSTEKSVNRKEDSINSCVEKMNDCEFEFETTLSDEEWRKLLDYCENDVAAQEEYYVRQSKEDEEKKEDTKKTCDDTKTNNDLSVEDLLDEYYNARRFGDFINLLFGKKDSKKPCEEKKDNSDSLLDKFNKYYNKNLSIEDMFDLYYMPYLR